MKKKTVSVLFLITLLVGLNIAVPTAVGKPNGPGDNEAMTQDQNAVNSAAATSRKLGLIQVGPSASGEGVRILSTAYTLRPLRGKCPNCLGIVVGPADLSTPSIIAQLRAAYEAGRGIALTNATPAGIKQLHDVLGHRGSAQPPPEVASADLVGFRKALRADGQLHSSSHVLLPRTTPAGMTRLAKKEKDKRQQVADANDVKALQRIFSAKPVVPDPPPADDQPNIINLAESYESHGIQSDSNGDQVQLTNSVWAARSFDNTSDFYYVSQEVDYSLNAGNSTVLSWSNFADASLGLPNVALLQPSPQTTMEATQVTSGVSTSIGESVGFNTSMGLNASVTQTKTITNTKSTTVPAMDVTNNPDFIDAVANWGYDVNDLSRGGVIDLFNQWIWQVPFSSYAGQTPQGEILLGSDAGLGANLSNLGQVGVSVSLGSSVPWPFGQTFSIQPPVVTGVSPGCVNSGDSFTINGTGLYPSLVQAVLINGTAVDSSAITTVSDTQLNVIAPDTIECHLGCPVAVQTNEETSNTNFNIEISVLCGD